MKKLFLAVLLMGVAITLGCTGITLSDKINIKEAFELGGSYKCDYDLFKGVSMVIWVKDERYRIQSATEANPSHSNSINNGVDIYYWLEEQKQGFKYKIADLEKMAKNPGIFTKQDLEKKSGNIYCTKENIEDSIFIPPSDVEFLDPFGSGEYSKAMEKSREFWKNMEEQGYKNPMNP